MKFDCKEISINDEEYGCTLTLSENEEIEDPSIKETIDDLVSSHGRYILLQRTYAEDDLDSDYFYIENSDFDKSGEFKNFSIELWRTRFVLTYDHEVVEVNIDPNEHEFKSLKNILMKIAYKNGRCIIHE
jgi:hypothetical protein